MGIKSIKSVKKLKDKTILVRCDFDVPLSHRSTKTPASIQPSGQKHKNTIKILNDNRLQTCLPTIKYLLKKKVKKIILMGYVDRPEGKVVKSLSLEFSLLWR